MSKFIRLTEITDFDMAEGITEVRDIYVNVDSICYVCQRDKMFYPNNKKVFCAISLVWFNNHFIEVVDRAEDIMYIINQNK